MDRVYNFSAGPSMLPLEVLEKASSEMTNYNKTGMSVMELSHRSSDFEDIINRAREDFKDLMHIPDNYEILFLQGGASNQFSAIPLNFMNASNKADYVLTGQWAKKAFEEAKRFGDVREAASSADQNFSYVPILSPEDFREDADYVHITGNNTIYGTRYRPEAIPDTGEIPLIADYSSSILSEMFDINKFGMIYAGAQKNIGPAGLVIAVIREDLLDHASPNTPVMLNYSIQAKNNSLYNTPPTYGIYIAGLVFDWLKRNGGVEAMEKINKQKAGKLYDFLDNSKMFTGTVTPKDRSLMNIPFVIGDPELEAKFIKEAAENGLVNLKGHRSVGGMRASIYNAMPIEGVTALTDFMEKFEKENV